MKLQNITATAIAACSIALGAGAVSAATFGILLDTPIGDNDFDSDLESVFGSGNVGFGVLLNVTVDGVETLTFEGWGAESNFNNTFSITGSTPGTISENNESFGSTDDIISTVFAAGALAPGDLEFHGDSGAVVANIGDEGMGVYFSLDGTLADSSPADFIFLAYDDDGAGEDDNHDDFLVKVTGDIVPNVVPLPAAGWMLLAGLGGLAAMRRRQKS